MVIWLCVTVIFFMMIIIPGDPVRALLGSHGDPDTVKYIRKSYGLDQKIHKRYLIFISRVLRGDLGKSYRLHRDVREVILERFPATFKIACMSIIMASVIGILLGLIAAVNKQRLADKLILLFSLIGISTPVFWLGLILLYIFSIKYKIFPFMGYESSTDIYHAFLPALTLALILTGFITRLMRASALEELKSQYLIAAKSRGIRTVSLYGKHLLRNAVLPVLTVIGLEFAGLLGGAVATEYIFDWPGIGSLLLESIQSRDIPVVEGGVIFLSFIYIIMNFLVDILYTIINPRIGMSCQEAPI